MAEEKNYAFPMIAIVAIVAIISVVVLIISARAGLNYTTLNPEVQNARVTTSESSRNIAGQAAQSTFKFCYEVKDCGGCEVAQDYICVHSLSKKVYCCNQLPAEMI